MVDKIHNPHRAQNHHSFFDQLYIFEFRWVSVCMVVSISPDAIYCTTLLFPRVTKIYGKMINEKCWSIDYLDPSLVSHPHTHTLHGNVLFQAYELNKIEYYALAVDDQNITAMSTGFFSKTGTKNSEPKHTGSNSDDTYRFFWEIGTKHCCWKSIECADVSDIGN